MEFFSQNLEGSKGNVGDPLSQQLFNSKLKLLSVLVEQLEQEQGVGGMKAAERMAVYGLTAASRRIDKASYLHSVVSGMSLNNFVERPQRRWVELWNDAKVWHKVTDDQLVELTTHVSGLPSSVEPTMTRISIRNVTRRSLMTDVFALPPCLKARQFYDAAKEPSIC